MNDQQDPPTTDLARESDAPSDVVTPGPMAVVIDWQSLPKSICKGLVKAQSVAKTVDNDGKVSGTSKSSGKSIGFTFPTAAAIACRAREALDAGKLAIMCTRWAPRYNGNGLESDWIIMSETEVSPTITVAIPMASGSDPVKALGATMSYTRKYFLASILNMGWNDPREEVETMNQQPQRRGGGGGGQHHHEPPRVTERTTVKQLPKPEPKPEPKPKSKLEPSQHDNPKLRDSLDEVRKIFSELKIETERFWHIATGMDRMPGRGESIPGHQLRACILAARNMKSCEDGNCAPEKWTHASYIQVCMCNDFTFTMHEGSANKDGVEYDESVRQNDG